MGVAEPGVVLTAVPEEPRHRGMHLAVVAADVAPRLGVSGGHDDRAPRYVRLVNPATGAAGYARLHTGEHLAPGIVAVQGYILDNAGITAGESVRVERWDPERDARPATEVTLSRVAGLPAGRVQAGGVRVRLTDSGLTFLPGHRFSLPAGGTDLTFEVIAADPPDVPVRCTPETVLTLQDATGPDTADRTTGRPEAAEDVFADIGGLDAAIRRITELVIWPAEQPELFARLGIGAARGIILHGPPGTGKTLLARAVAKRMGAHFFLINGPEVMSKFYGEAERRLREVFAEAAEKQPSVVFIDELDSIAPSRDRVSGDLEVRLVSQLLTLLDGLHGRGQVVVIGATNRPAAIDPALRRPGRFDHEVEIAAPDQAGRRDILRVHSRGTPLAAGVDLDDLAERTVGFVGADLASLVQEAAFAAARRLMRTSLDPASLSRAEVGPDDFAEGLRTVQPSAFRELRPALSGPDWDDLTGLEAAKQALLQLVDWPLTRRDRLAGLGVARSGALLLTGPPLGGKTCLVGALARRMSATLLRLPAIELLSPWAGEAERMIRDTFVKARQTSPSIVLIDDLDRLPAGDPGLVRRLLAQVGNEMTKLTYATAASVIVTARTGGLPPAVRYDPLFSDVVELGPPSSTEIRAVVQRRLAPYLDGEVTADELAAELRDRSIGEALRVCDDALTGALWDEPDHPVVRKQHLITALDRATHTRTTSPEEDELSV
ncbi:ATPase [Actinoplanes capillaceus]|uniref:ATPase n=1 Tax=Actinoplanes campanulatus TaxID=113559 RepID=A0ABQ3WMR7_9ACTN|nr:ATPase [Actinoplanes capillaceus]